ESTKLQNRGREDASCDRLRPSSLEDNSDRDTMNILLGITGSVAAYKSVDLARLMVKGGHKVRVILTQGALEFIKAETFKYLGVEEVYGPLDDFNPGEKTSHSNVLHIDLAKWADKIAVAPASANTISKMATGLTNDLLTSVFL